MLLLLEYRRFLKSFGFVHLCSHTLTMTPLKVLVKIIKSCDWFLTLHMAVTASKGLKKGLSIIS